jgi:hypothetical protein
VAREPVLTRTLTVCKSYVPMPAIAPHSTPTSAGTWDGPAAEASLPNADLARFFAWRDPDGDPTAKATFRFIHHHPAGAANITACQTGIGVLNGGRGGTTIPPGDRRGVYAHLARHLRDADLEPPEAQFAGPSPPLRTVTLTGVELVRTGTWAAATGVTTVTLDDLRAMLAAAADPEVDAAAIRIGHLDPRFDGEPALGWVTNLRLGDTTDTAGALIGDLEDVPAELAELIPRAFRRRSVEIGWNVRTPSGRRYRAALTGLALLGVAPPAVKGLADVLARYSAGDPRRAPHTHAGDELYLADGEATEVGQAIAAARAALAALPALDPALELVEPEEVPTVTITDERLRELLGVEETADLEASIVALRTRAETPGDPGGGGGEGEPAPTPPGDPGTPPPDNGNGDNDDNGDNGAPTPPAGEGTVVVSAAALAALQANATAGAEARRILRTQEVEAELTSALGAGRIAPADVPAWRTRLDADYEGTRTLLSALTPVFPTSELGSDAGDNGNTDAEFEAWMAETLGVTPNK